MNELIETIVSFWQNNLDLVLYCLLGVIVVTGAAIGFRKISLRLGYAMLKPDFSILTRFIREIKRAKDDLSSSFRDYGLFTSEVDKRYLGEARKILNLSFSVLQEEVIFDVSNPGGVAKHLVNSYFAQVKQQYPLYNLMVQLNRVQENYRAELLSLYHNFYAKWTVLKNREIALVNGYSARYEQIDKNKGRHFSARYANGFAVKRWSKKKKKYALDTFEELVLPVFAEKSLPEFSPEDFIVNVKFFMGGKEYLYSKPLIEI